MIANKARIDGINKIILSVKTAKDFSGVVRALQKQKVLERIAYNEITGEEYFSTDDLIDTCDEIANQALIDIKSRKYRGKVADLCYTVKTEEAMLGKLRKSSIVELRDKYNSEFNSTNSSIIKAITPRANMDYQAEIRKNQYISAGEKNEIWKKIANKYQNEALEKTKLRLSEKFGIDIDTLDSQVMELNAKADKMEADMIDVGNKLLAEIRLRYGMPASDVATVRNKVQRSNAAKTACKDIDTHINDFLSMYGGAARGASTVSISTISEMQRKFPRMFSSGRGVIYSYGNKMPNGGHSNNIIGIPSTRNDESRSYRRTVWHELGHWLEHENVAIAAIVKAWFKIRTKDDKETPLKNLIPGSGYASNEVAKPDNFIDPYIGKIYRVPNSTEVVSMGFEYLSDPKSAAILSQRDPDMFALILKLMEVAND